MNLRLQPTETVEARSEATRSRLASDWGEPLFLADWLRAVFFHYEVPAEALQPDVPFELDLRDGKAYVSLVAFTMDRMRPRLGGRLAAWLWRPIASNRFLNVRTYVRHRGEPGIYFIREWLDNRLSVLLGPRTFGLPYHFGELDYGAPVSDPARAERRSPDRRDDVELSKRADLEIGAPVLTGVVRESATGPRFAYRATLPAGARFEFCPAGSLDEFLIERYIAFTACQGTRRFFRVYHPPWPQTRVDVQVSTSDLLTRLWSWFSHARLACAHYSPGLRDVWMGRPQRVAATPRKPRRRLSAFWSFPGE